jgi:ketosteroid isomerase-like protein
MICQVRRAIAASTCLLFVAIQPISAAGDNRAAKEKEVAATVHDLVDAYSKNDYERYFGHMHDNVAIWAAGDVERWTKKKYYDMWKANIEKGGGITKAAVADLRVQMSPSGDAAISTYLMPMTSRIAPGAPPGPDGKPRQANEIQAIMSAVWFQQNGKWVMNSFYWSSPRPPAGASR